ncbi:hypothetical protein ACFLQ0_00060 [Nitrospinota bacterium]
MVDPVRPDARRAMTRRSFAFEKTRGGWESWPATTLGMFRINSSSVSSSPRASPPKGWSGATGLSRFEKKAVVPQTIPFGVPLSL